jgi:branched-chain amino acid transport system substrate-binding protein
MKSVVALTFATLLAATSFAKADDNTIRIGVLTDMSGAYSDNLGQGAVEAAKIAIEEFGSKIGDKPVELVIADHQNKPDVGVSLIRRWIDVDGVDVITEIGNSAVALAARDVVEQKHKLALVVGAAAIDLQGQSCSRFVSQWNLDTYASANAITKALVQQGGDKWYFISVDYTYGNALQAAATKTIESLGGKVLGAVKHPLGATDFSSYLLEAQNSGANVIGFLSAGTELAQALKQANEFGLSGGPQKLVPFLLFPSHVRAIGLEGLKGLVFADSFYADHNDKTKEFMAKYMARMDNKVPTSNQVAEYLAVRNYLLAVQKAGTDDSTAVSDALHTMDIDNFGEPVKMRADGRVMRDLYVLQVNSPSEAKTPTDYFKYLSTIPAETAYRPLSESDCPLVKG